MPVLYIKKKITPSNFKPQVFTVCCGIEIPVITFQSFINFSISNFLLVRVAVDLETTTGTPVLRPENPVHHQEISTYNVAFQLNGMYLRGGKKPTWTQGE